MLRGEPKGRQPPLPGSKGGNYSCFLLSPSHSHTSAPNLTLATGNDVPKVHVENGKGWPCLFSLTSETILISTVIIYLTKTIDQRKLISSQCLPLSTSGLLLVAPFLCSFSHCFLFPLLKATTIQCSSCFPGPSIGHIFLQCHIIASFYSSFSPLITVLSFKILFSFYPISSFFGIKHCIGTYSPLGRQ